MSKRKKPKKPKQPLPLLLKPHRERRGWSQVKLAEEMGWSDASVVRAEKGKQNWSQEFLQDAARALEIHWWELLPLERERARAREVLRVAIQPETFE